MPIDPAKLAPPGVRTLAPYMPGKPIAELEREYGISDSIKLASNENPLGPGRGRSKRSRRRRGRSACYPDGSGFELKQALARKHGCSTDCIVLGNGSNDVLVLIAQAFLAPQSEAVYSQYAFAVYPIAVQATGATARIAPANPAGHAMPLGHDLAAMAQLDQRAHAPGVRRQPEQPDRHLGRCARRCGASSQRVPEQTLVVVDEAYNEYVSEPEFPDASRWLGEFPNLVVTRTFSKAYGLAGLRVGYALSHPSVADMMNRVRQPFNVNTIALAAALAALDDSEHLKRSVETNRAGMAQLRAGFDALGVRQLPSAGNFVMIDCGRPAPRGVRSDAAAGRDRAAGRQLRAAQSPADHHRNARTERAHAGGAQTSAASMTEYLVAPSSHVLGTVRVPGDKSISHRALMLGGIADGITEVRGFLESEDCLATMRAMRALGVHIEQTNAREIRVHGVGRAGLKAATHALDMGNAGTAMRLMTGLLAGQSFDSVLIGDASLTKRPMGRVATPLRQMGARIETAIGQAAAADPRRRALAAASTTSCRSRARR